MIMRKYIMMGLVALFVALGVYATVTTVALNNAKKDRDTYERNMEVALTECEAWRTADSLSAAKNGILELKVAELEKYRKEDFEQIKALKRRNESLNSLLADASVTKVEVKTVVRDSIVYRDSSKLKAKTFSWKDNWTSVEGVLIKDSVDLNVVSKDSLVVGVTTEYKRFLGFLWKTNKIKSQSVYALSKNPHTTISNIDYVNVKK